MHEYSVARRLLRQVDAVRRAHAGERVGEVRVEAGPLSGIEPELLRIAFDQLVHQGSGRSAAPEWLTAFTNATLIIDEIGLTAECQQCDTSFEIQEFIFRCPDCDGNVRVLTGDCLELVSVGIIDSTPNGASLA